MLLDAGLCLLSPDGQRLATAVWHRLGRVVSAETCIASYRRCIHRRDTTGSSEAEFDWWASWCDFASLPRACGPDVAALARELELATPPLWVSHESGAGDLLRMLKSANMGVAIVSNSNGHLRSEFEAAGLHEHIDVYVDSAVEGWQKPDIALFGIGLDRLGVSASQAAFVGDDYRLDILPAQMLGFARVLHYDPLGLYHVGWQHERVQRLDEIPCRLGLSMSDLQLGKVIEFHV